MSDHHSPDADSVDGYDAADLRTGFDYVQDTEPAAPEQGEEWYATGGGSFSEGAYVRKADGTWKEETISDHGKLSGVTSDDHHTRYSDSEARQACNSQIDADTVDGQHASDLGADSTQSRSDDDANYQFPEFVQTGGWSDTSNMTDGDTSTTGYTTGGADGTLTLPSRVFISGFRVYFDRIDFSCIFENIHTGETVTFDSGTTTGMWHTASFSTPTGRIRMYDNDGDGNYIHIAELELYGTVLPGHSHQI